MHCCPVGSYISPRRSGNGQDPDYVSMPSGYGFRETDLVHQIYDMAAGKDKSVAASKRPLRL